MCIRLGLPIDFQPLRILRGKSGPVLHPQQTDLDLFRSGETIRSALRFKFRLIRAPVIDVFLQITLELFPLFPQHNFTLTRCLFGKPPDLFHRSLPPVVQFRRNRLRFQPGGAAFLLRSLERLFLRPQPESGFHMLLLINSPAGGEQFLPLLLRFAPEHLELLLFLLIHIGFPVDQ